MELADNSGGAKVAITREVAEVEFDRFADTWDLDTDVAAMLDEDRDSFNPLKQRLVRKIMQGRLTVNEDGSELTYTLSQAIGEVAQMTAKIPTGGAILQFDKHKDRHNVAKLNAFMGSMCSCAPALFGQTMLGTDLKVMQAIATLFLAS